MLFQCTINGSIYCFRQTKVGEEVKWLVDDKSITITNVGIEKAIEAMQKVLDIVHVLNSKQTEEEVVEVIADEFKESA